MKKKTKKRLKKFLLWLIVILLVPIVFAIILYAYLDRLVELVSPAIAENYGIKNFNLKVNTLSWDKMILKELKGGDNDGIAIREIKFSRSQGKNNPNEIIVSNAVINLNELDGKFFIPGVSLPSSNPSLKQTAPKSLVSILKIPPALAGFTAPGVVLKIKDSRFVFTDLSLSGSKKIEIPFELKFYLDKDGFFKLIITSEIKDIKDSPYLTENMTCRKIKIDLQAAGTLNSNKSCENVIANIAVSCFDISYKKNKQMAIVPKLELNCLFKQQREKFNGLFLAELNDCQYQAGKFRLSGIYARTPVEFVLKEKLQFPEKLSAKSGKLEIGCIEMDRKKLGNAELTYQQKGHDFELKGNIKPDFLKEKDSDTEISLKGNVAIPENDQDSSVSANAEIDFNNLEFDIGKVISKMKGYNFQGNAKIKAGFDFKDKKLSSHAKLAIKDSLVSQVEKGFSVEGLNVDFEMPDLMSISSSPAQKVKFNSLKYGALEFGEGNLQFQLESKKILFLEKSDIQWCDGEMDFGAVRINFNKPEDLEFTFYCNRLRVSDLLTQLKVAQVSGGGRVAGRIPIKYINNKLEIKNGFLYSTPGEGGRIKLFDFAGSELTDASIQMAIAREALKDYKYKWIRLYFNTVKDSLFIKLEMDGAPGGKLPFSYDEKTVLKKSGRDDLKASFQGISFDINFNIPIDDIIYYSKKTGNLFK